MTGRYVIFDPTVLSRNHQAQHEVFEGKKKLMKNKKSCLTMYKRNSNASIMIHSRGYRPNSYCTRTGT